MVLLPGESDDNRLEKKRRVLSKQKPDLSKETPPECKLSIPGHRRQEQRVAGTYPCRAAPALRSGLDPVSFQLFPQRLPADAEHFSGPRFVPCRDPEDIQGYVLFPLRRQRRRVRVASRFPSKDKGGRSSRLITSGGSERDGSLDDVFQFTHVAGEVMGHDRLKRLFREPHGPAELRLPYRSRKNAARAGMSSPAPERRERDRRSGGRKRSSLEPPRLDLVFKALVRGRDQPYINLDALRAADALDRPLLQHPEQLGLGRGEIADLVEEDRAAVGKLEPAGFFYRAGERPRS